MLLLAAATIAAVVEGLWIMLVALAVFVALAWYAWDQWLS
jgi:hypothetical protein